MDEKKLDLLLSAWEETYKKGQLTFWILLSLKEGEKYVDEIRSFVESKTDGVLTCEEQSLYRALRKLEHVEVLSCAWRKGNKGPDRKYYSLTPMGERLFERFVERNIVLLNSDDVKRLLKP
jgi:PadR family transcriptional regulator PadR